MAVCQFPYVDGRKEGMFYLTTHSTHFIYGYFLKDHADSERENLLPPHGLHFLINSKGYFNIHDTTAFVTLVMENWLE